MLKKKDIVDAAKAFDSSRYPFAIYRHNLTVLKKAKTVNADVETSVRELFLWRMGKVRKGEVKGGVTRASDTLSFTDREGDPYHAAKVSWVTERAIRNATSHNLLENAILFRKNKISYEEFNPMVRKIVVSSIYFPCYFLHLWKPERFPLFDRKTWAIYRQDRNQSVSFTGPLHHMTRYLEYIEWFEEIVNRKSLDRWTVQVGLWELGRRLEKKLKQSKT